VGAWLEGLLEGSALELLFSEGLWEAVDTWVTGLAAEAFGDLLPLLRRAFAAFSPAERHRLGARVRGGAAVVAADDEIPIDTDRASRVLGVLALILGSDAGARAEAGIP